MKCDKLKAYKGDVTIPVYGTIADAKVYLKKDVDEAIDELKTEHHKERDEYISMVHSRERTIKELKQKLEDVNELIKTARQMLEDAKATHYTEMVDAGMRERRLKRALWLARALRARDIQRWWIAATCSKTTERACSVWNNVEHKCRAKAEEYK